MSSSDEDVIHNSSIVPSTSTGLTPDGSPNKKRKIMRACDFCRRKKIKCDASSKERGQKCTSCIVHKRDCTFIEGARKRGPPKGYMEFLENRVDQLEDTLSKLAPTYNIEKELGPRHTPTTWVESGQPTNFIRTRTSRSLVTVKQQPPSPPSAVLPMARVFQFPPGVNTPGPVTTAEPGSHSSAATSSSQKPDDLESSEEESYCPPELILSAAEDANGILSERFSQLGLDRPYFGKASGVQLLGRARSIMSEMLEKNRSQRETPPERRPEFWKGKHPWEDVNNQMDESVKFLIYPPPDLHASLVALYFRHFHPIFPMLHQPTFDRQFKDGLHKRNMPFGFQVLLVYAVGSRWSDDPRVCLGWESEAPIDATINWLIAGWPFFEQMLRIPHAFRPSAQLHDLQNIVLMGFYMHSTLWPHSIWLVGSIGVRMAMDLGAHRRKAYRNDGSLEDELWKRTFWSLVVTDRLTSIALGRPTAVNDEDIDAELPLDVDDATWDESTREWRIPSTKPSILQATNHLVKLLQITTFSIRTIYSINKSRIHLGFVGAEWERHIVSELDSALNSWIDKIPPHLQWDPNTTDLVTFDQSVMLNLYYRHAQIIIHKPFLPGISKKDSPLAFPSLAICSNAARSISHILEAHRRRKLDLTNSNDPLERTGVVMPLGVGVGVLAGLILLMTIWNAKRSGDNVDIPALTDDLLKITEYIKLGEARHSGAGRLWDLFQELISATGIPQARDGDSVPKRPVHKRSRTETEEDVPDIQTTTREAPKGDGSLPPAFHDLWAQFGMPMTTASTTLRAGNSSDDDPFAVLNLLPQDHEGGSSTFLPFDSNPEAFNADGDPTLNVHATQPLAPPSFSFNFPSPFGALQQLPMRPPATQQSLLPGVFGFPGASPSVTPMMMDTTYQSMVSSGLMASLASGPKREPPITVGRTNPTLSFPVTQQMLSGSQAGNIGIATAGNSNLNQMASSSSLPDAQRMPHSAQTDKDWRQSFGLWLEPSNQDWTSWTTNDWTSVGNTTGPRNLSRTTQPDQASPS